MTGSMGYNIIGEDKREYGPVELDEVCEWICEGRANASTRICREGENEWKAASDFPEFGEALGLTRPDVSPPPSSPNLLPFAVFLNLCCCPPLGLVATIFAAFALAKYSAGDWVGSTEAAAKARQWCWYSIALGIPFQILLQAYMKSIMSGLPLEALP